jgi:hypothetical protein
MKGVLVQALLFFVEVLSSDMISSKITGWWSTM